MRFRIKYADKIVGLFVILAFLGLAASVILLGSQQRWFARDFRFETRLASASGAAPGTAIYMRGFQVGKVEDLELVEGKSVLMRFIIYDTYRPLVREFSVIELLTSPIGLGTQILFHPGRGDELLDEGGFVPEASSPEGAALIEQELVDMPLKDDTISRLLSSINPLIENVNKTVVTVNRTLTEINRALSGQSQGPLGGMIEDVAAAVEEVGVTAARLGSLVDSVDLILSQVSGILAKLDATVAGVEPLMGQVEGIMKQVSGVVERVDGLVVKAGGIVDTVDGAIVELTDSATETVADLSGAAQETLDSLSGTADRLVVDLGDEVKKLLAELPPLVDQVSGLLEETDSLMRSVGRSLANVESLTASLSDPQGLVPKLLDPKGSIATFLDDKNRLYESVLSIVNQGEQALKSVQTIITGLGSEVPGISATLAETRTAIKQAQDVLEGLKNNPLIKGGVPERLEGQQLYGSMREGDF